MNDELRQRAHNARAAIEAGTLRGAALGEEILAIPFGDRDAWIDELIGFDALPADAPLPRGSVPYLPASVEEILTMVREVPVSADDVLVDLGSGVGRVLILAHLMTGARAVGIEIQEHLVAEARARCKALCIRGVTFDHANAAEIDLDGGVFFLYAPFNGEMLTAVLRQLQAVAQRRPIIVAAVGVELEGVPWLRARKTSCVSLMIYESPAHSIR